MTWTLTDIAEATGLTEPADLTRASQMISKMLPYGEVTPARFAAAARRAATDITAGRDQDQAAWREYRHGQISAAASGALAVTGNANTQAGILLTVATGVLTGVAVLLRSARGPAVIPLWAVAAAAAAACMALLLAVRPRGISYRSFLLRDHLFLLYDDPAGTNPQRHAEDRLRTHSAIAAAKLKRIKAGCDLLITAAVILAAAAPFTLT